MEKKSRLSLDAFQGSLLAGAIGDALGYPIEFLDVSSIKDAFGFVQSFVDDTFFSDDTQMTDRKSVV